MKEVSDFSMSSTVANDISMLKMKIDALSKDNNTLHKRLDRITKTSREAKVMALEVRDLVGGDLLTKAKEDAFSIHDLYGVVFLKTVVATEVLNCYLASGPKDIDVYKMSIAIISSYDQDNLWWKSKEKYELKEWIEEFKKIIKN